MGSMQDCVGNEILQVGKCLTELLRKTLCPSFVRDSSTIMLASPWEQTDYRVGIYLYDIQDYSFAATQAVMISETERRFPPKAVELSYLLFCNENSRFGGIKREQIQILLNEMIRAIYDFPVVSREDGEEVQLSFSRETMDFKIRLWGSFNQPLQPAVYVKAVPVLIESGRTAEAAKVEERDYRVGKKE